MGGGRSIKHEANLIKHNPRRTNHSINLQVEAMPHLPFSLSWGTLFFDQWSLTFPKRKNIRSFRLPRRDKGRIGRLTHVA